VGCGADNQSLQIQQARKFEVQWYGGEVTWEPYRAISHLELLRQYFKALGVKQAHQLPVKDGVDTVETASDNSKS
jgi:sulfatase maturation enzyme AslB (radical SAM superfamily)